MSLVQFIAISSGRQCKCGCKEHGFLIYLCNVTTLKDFGSVPFHIIETEYRIRKVYVVDSTANPVEHKEFKIARTFCAAAVPTDESE